MAQPTQLEKRLRSLEDHLAQENPILLRAVKSFRILDKVARGLGFFNREESYATRVPWWPLIAVLGTYSSGKSTFINYYLGHKLQSTGNQAVDDKFTVICFGSEDTSRVLPGLALDADPRFPFYQISRDIEETAPGEGRRIDAYLQLKTSPTERVRGKILIDSPGFDADAQRTSTLRITDHIIDLSDLVLVFFDARHPEPGTMHDTLEHLVAHTVQRADSSKFLYILNQIDATAREDNPEDVVASWQRALSQVGLTAGRFYRIYNPEAAVPIDDENLRTRFEAKRDADMADIEARMQQVEVDRAYRVIAVLEQTAHDIVEKIVPKLRTILAQWRRRVLWTDGLLFGTVIVAIVALTVWAADPFWLDVFSDPVGVWVALGVLAALALITHFVIRRATAKRLVARLRQETTDRWEKEYVDNFIRAFHKNTRFWHSVFHKRPTGWSKRTQQRLKDVLVEANRYVQDLNDKYTNPSGAETVNAVPTSETAPPTSETAPPTSETAPPTSETAPPEQVKV
jgi:hypothetical protein